MQLSAGTTLLHYRITGFLGKGGMGTVYLAEDTKLRRDVAIKVLPPEFGRDEERLARFDREARLLATLNHPHIATIHGVDNVDGTRFIVMEHVRGETLADRIARGPLPIDEAIAVARQIASALEAAHEKGVIHRDLKPGNIVIDDDANVKVLDFGLAANITGDSGETDIQNSPTVPVHGTSTGVILGTAGYMSPEQARGRKADRRADVWAFGVVLFEMLTGRRLFTGESVSEALAAVLKEEPHWNALPPETPATVRRLLRRCLAKQPADRMRDFGDIRLELGENDDQPEIPRRPAARRNALPWVIAAAAIALAAFGLWRSGHAAPLRLIKTSIGSQLENGWNASPAISPDGRRVAYAAEGALWIRSLDELEARQIPVVGRLQPVLFWSPDSRWVVFISGEKIWKLDPAGSAPVPIAPLPHTTAGGTPMTFHSGAWGADDHIVLAVYKGGLYELSARGGSPSELMPPQPGLVDFHTLSFLPDGKTLLAVPHGMSSRSTVEVIRDGKRRTVFTLPTVVRDAAYSPSGHLLVSGSGIDAGIWAVPFSPEKLSATGKPFLVLANAGACTASSDGSLLYVANIDSAPRQLVHIDRKGAVIVKIGEPADGLSTPVISHDERMLAVTMRDSENHLSTSLIDLATGARRQLTRGVNEDHPWGWTRDDRRLLVHRDSGIWADPNFGVWLVPVDGSGGPRLLANGFVGSLTPDEQSVVYVTIRPRDDPNIAVRALREGASPVELVRSPYPKSAAVLSPDGRFLAYASTEGGSQEVYVVSFPSGEGRWQVSQSGGSAPRWGPDGQTLYFVSGGKLFAVSPTPSAKPALVVDGAATNVALGAGYTVLRDGSVIAVQDLPAAKRQVILVQNWIEEFR